MDHLQFKANQTAAGYVADGLDESTQEGFELHLMGCSECVEDVEVWRAIKLDMPRRRPEVHAIAPRGPHVVFRDWRMAASLVGVGILGATGGWLGKATTATDLDSTETVIVNLPSVSRGADECIAAHLAADTQMLVIRVPGVSKDSHVVVLDSERHELPAQHYVSRIQPDGSALIRINASVLSEREIWLEARDRSGTSNPIGCLSGAPPHSSDR